MSISKEERAMWNDVLKLTLVHEPLEGTDAAEVLSFVRNRAPGVFDHIDNADSTIAEYQQENERLRNEVHRLYALNRAEHDSRGGV